MEKLHCLPRELIARGTSRDFAELMAYFHIESEDRAREQKRDRKGKPLEHKAIPYQR